MTTAATRSEVADAGQIFDVVIDAQDFDGWLAEDQTGLSRRTGRLTIRVERVLLGEVDQDDGQPFELEIVQRATADRSVWDYYGLWSHTPTATGTRLTAFCDGAVSDARLALTDEHCARLVDADSVAADLGVVVELERRRATADQMLDEAERVKRDCGALFARYVWANVRTEVATSLDAFSRLMRIAEDPSTDAGARECYLTAAYEDTTFSELLPAPQRARLARAMLRASTMPTVGELRGQVLETYLPNLVEADPELGADVVFADEPALQDVVRDDAQRAPGDFPARLRGWLDGGAS